MTPSQHARHREALERLDHHLALTPQQRIDQRPMQLALHMIRVVAKCRSDWTSVYWAAQESRFPLLQHKRDKKKGRQSRVIVGKDWVKDNLPKAWAAICAARVTGVDADLVPKQAERHWI